MMDVHQYSLKTPGGLDLSLRRLSPADIPQVMLLEHAAHTYPWRQSSFEACIGGRQVCWLAFAGEQLVGYCVIAHGGGDAELLNLVVAQPFQRRGIGACLLEFAQETLRDHADMLFLEVRMSNRKAIELYARAGFFEVGQRKNYYPAVRGHEDALLMACQLR